MSAVVPERVDAEIVADANVEIRLAAGGGEQRAGIKARVAHLRAFRVGVALDGEGEGLPAALRMKRAFRPGRESTFAGLAALQAVKVCGVGMEVVENGLDGFARSEGCGLVFACIIARRCDPPPQYTSIAWANKALSAEARSPILPSTSEECREISRFGGQGIVIGAIRWPPRRDC